VRKPKHQSAQNTYNSESRPKQTCCVPGTGSGDKVDILSLPSNTSGSCQSPGMRWKLRERRHKECGKCTGDRSGRELL